MKLKFTRKTWYFLLLASAAASMLNGFAVLSGTSFGLIEQIAFAAAGIAALFLAAEKGSASWEKRNFTGVFVLLMVSYMVKAVAIRRYTGGIPWAGSEIVSNGCVQEAGK